MNSKYSSSTWVVGTQLNIKHLIFINYDSKKIISLYYKQNSGIIIKITSGHEIQFYI